MKMIELQAGLGFGVKKFSLVWVFETPATLGTFVNSGWELGGQTSVAAKAGEKGASLQGAMPRLARRLALSAHRDRPGAGTHGEGTKYYKDDDLN